MRRRLIALLGVLALTVAACGGGDDDTNAGSETENTDDSGSSRRTQNTDDEPDEGDVDEFCQLNAEADALGDELSDEASPDEFEEFLDAQRELIDQGRDVVPAEIADDFDDFANGYDAIVEAAADADFDITDEAFNDEAEVISEGFADAADVLDEFEADNCETDEPATTQPEPETTVRASTGDLVAYCAAETAAAALTLPDDPTPRQLKQYLLTQEDLVEEARANVPAEIAAEYDVVASTLDLLLQFADESGYDINEEPLAGFLEAAAADESVAEADELVDAFDAANCEGEPTSDGEGDPLALCAADETLNLLADDLFATGDPVDIESAFIALIVTLEQAVLDAPAEVRPDLETLLSGFISLEEAAASFGYDLADPDFLAVLEAIFEDPASIEASENLDTWVAANCDSAEPVGGDDAGLDEIAGLCSSGNLFACDVLYTTSDFGSELENLALSCGGDSMLGTGGACFDESPFLAIGDSAEMDAIGDLCAAGNGQACYGLYINSAVGSEYEVVGGTCAFQQEEGDDPFNCVTGDVGA